MTRHFIKDKKIYFDKTVFKTILYNEKIRIIGVFFWIKDPDPVFSRVRIRVTQKDRIQPDPDPDLAPQHCRIEIIQIRYFCCVY